MNRIQQFLASTVTLAALFSPATAEEIWTYRFIVNGSRPYYYSGDVQSYAADVAGSFSILIDWQTATGRLLQLNDHLTNVAIWADTPNGSALVPANWPELDYGVISLWGELSRASVPLTYFNGSGHISTANSPYPYPFPYDITFDLHQANFNLTVPIADAYGQVTNATAVFDRAMVAGDYYHDVRVDARDYVALRNRSLPSFDFDLWRANFGKSYATTPTVPEPTGILLVIVTTFVRCAIRQRRLDRQLAGQK